MTKRALLTTLALVLLVTAACGSSNTTPGASASVGTLPSSSGPVASGEPSATVPSATPGPTVDESFCGTIAALQDALSRFEAIKVKSANRAKLRAQADGVVATLDAIEAAAAPSLANKVNTLKTAANGLSSAAEDYATTSKPATAASRIEKARSTLKNAITSLRTAAACTN